MTVLAICLLLSVMSQGQDDRSTAATVIPPAPSPTSPSEVTVSGSPEPEPTRSPEPSHSASSSPRPTPSAAAPVTTAEITRPENGDRLREDRDFEVEGSVRNLGKEDLRLFIYAEKRSTFYLADYRAEDVHDGRWSIRSTGIGREFGREGDSHLVLAVTADGACRQRLSGLDTGDDHYPSFSALPRGCKVRAQIRVIEE